MKTSKSFPFKTSSITQARRFVGATLGTLPDSIYESVLLIVSELATNAIRHAGTGFSVEIALNREELRIAVVDVGDGKPTIGSPPPTQPSGRGLRIVEMLSDRWGIIPSSPEEGKTVWFSVKVKNPNRSLQDVQ